MSRDQFSRRRDDRPRQGRSRDDFDRRPLPPADDNSGSTAIKIVALIGGVFAVALLVCGGLAWYVLYSVKQGAQRVGDNFAEAVQRQQEQFERDQQEMRKQMEVARQKAEEQRQKDEQERKLQEARARQLRDEKLAARRKATQFANAFLGDAKAGRTAEAYAVTSEDYRRRVSAEQFAQLLRDNANTLRGIGTFMDKFVVFDQELDPPFTYSGMRPAQGGFVKVEATVVKDGDGWKVDQFFVGDYDPFKK